jgi:4-carboxymuconolactone decarboxylase
MSAVSVAKDVFAARHIGSEQLPPASGDHLPLDEAAEAQGAQIPFHLHKAMDNGLTRAEASEVLTHLAFYVGWPNVFSAIPVAKGVLDKRPT